MNHSNQIADIAAYFNLDLSERDKKKLSAILDSCSKTETTIHDKLKIVEVEKVVYIKEGQILEPSPKPIMKKIAQEITALYDLQWYNILEKCRKTNVTKAKVHFVRHIFLHYPQTHLKSISDFLQMREHTSIMFLKYDSKIECPIPPFPRRKIRKQNTNSHPQQINQTGVDRNKVNTNIFQWHPGSAVPQRREGCVY